MTAEPPTTVATDDDAAVSRAVRVELARLGRSQKELANSTNRTTSWLSDRLKGRASWKVGDVRAVATALGVPLSTLLPDPTED